MNVPVALATSDLTPCGRVPGTPLRAAYEELAYERTLGRSPEDACRRLWERGVRIIDPAGSSFASNARKVCQRPEIRERVNELAARGAELLEISAAWVLKETKLFAEASPAKFWERDENGDIVENNGIPQLDFSRATEDDLRTIKGFRPTKYGPIVELYDPNVARNQFGLHFGLWKGGGDTNVSVAQTAIVRLPAPSRDAKEWEMQYGPPAGP